MGTLHGWNNFGYVIYVPQISMYQNITKLLIHPSTTKLGGVCMMAIKGNGLNEPGVGFYGISTIVGNLMPNPVFTYILNIWSVNMFCRHTQLNDQTVLFLTIQFSIIQQS